MFAATIEVVFWLMPSFSCSYQCDDFVISKSSDGEVKLFAAWIKMAAL